MILQVSSRTDICALYPKWLIKRLKEGYVLVRNPYNSNQVSYLDIRREVVDCIAFCTKDPRAIMPYLNIIDQMDYQYYFMVTITPYDNDIEPALRPKLEIMKSFIELSNKIGRDKVIWRYDPILLTKRYTKEFHLVMFEKMCYLLSKYTKKVIISFIDIYKNIEGKFKELGDDEINELAFKLGKIAKKYHLDIQTCSEKYDLSCYGISSGSCIERQYIENLLGYPLNIATNKNRVNCNCLASIDIGAYNCCSHGCTYCYACNHESVYQNIQQHDQNSPLLIGNLNINDKVTVRKVSSNKQRQLSLKL